MSTAASNEQIVQRANEIYSAAASKHGTTNNAVLADRQTRQHLRFADLLEHVDLNNPRARLLEVGCGNAELYKYLAGRGYRGSYTGVDINEPLLAQARARFKDIDVRRHDVMKDALSERFDFVLMSGVFNLDYGQDLAWMQSFVHKMYDLAEQVMAFNALSTHTTFRTEGFVYVDPLAMLDYCIRNLSRRTTLAHHNVSYNYTVAVYRGAEIGVPCQE